MQQTLKKKTFSGPKIVVSNPHTFFGSMGTHCTADMDSNGGQTFRLEGNICVDWSELPYTVL